LIEACASLEEDLEKYEGDFEWDELLDMHFVTYNLVILVVKNYLEYAMDILF